VRREAPRPAEGGLLLLLLLLLLRCVRCFSISKVPTSF
jgi:hypothetical protein